MTLPVEDLQRELSPAEVEASIYSIQEALGLKVTSWRPGGVVRTINKVMAYLGSGFSRLVVSLNKSAFFDTATGKWLVRRVADICGPDVPPIEADFARGPVTIDNDGGGVYSYQPGQFLIKNGGTGKTFFNVDALSIGALETGIEATFQASEVGSASTSGPGEIDTLVTTALGVTVTNPAAFVGTDAESDDDYRVRARQSFGRLSPNGPRDAYLWRAKGVKRPDGTTIDVNRCRVSASGVPVLVTVASSSGVVDGDNSTPGTDVYLIQQAIDADVVPDGVTAEVSSATAHAVNVTATIYVDKTAQLDSGAVQTAVELKLTNLFKTLPIDGQSIGGSGYVFQSILIAQIKALELAGVDKADRYVIKVELAAPSSDVSISTGEVPTLGTVSITVVQV